MIIDGSPLKPLLRGLLVRLREGEKMPNRVTTVRMVRVRGGTEIQGIASSDRGTKYILNSVVVLHPRGKKHEYENEIAEAIESVLEGRH